MKIIFVGANPSHKTGSDPHTTPSIKRLYKWINEISLDRFSFTNASTKYTVKNKLPALSNQCLRLLNDQVYGYDKVIALGIFASDALNKICIDHYPMPHPSPLNRQFNQMMFESKCINDLRKYINMV